MGNSKKLVSFVKFDLVNALIKDRALNMGLTESAVVENAILDGMLPSNEDARQIVIEHLYSEDGSVEETLIHIFENSSQKKSEYSEYRGLIPIILYGRMQQERLRAVPSFAEFSNESQTRCILLIESMVRTADSECETVVQGMKLLNSFSSNPRSFGARDIFDFILCGWYDLKELDSTYELLIELVRCCEWINNSVTRTELLEAVKSSYARR